MSDTEGSKTSQKPDTKVPEVAVEDDSDPDFDDLDDVLDQFSANAPQLTTQSQPQPTSKPAPTSSGPGRPDDHTTAPPVPHGQSSSESDEEFMARLTAEMQNVMSTIATDPAASSASPEDIVKMGQQLEEFTQSMESQGIKPEDLLKAILGEDTGRRVSDAALEEADRRAVLSDSPSTSSKAVPSTSTTQPDAKSSTSNSNTAFEDSIKRAMSRLQTSETTAQTSTTQDQDQSSEPDILAQLLRAMESEASSSDPNSDNLSNMFLSMMDTLTHKDMLYEPMAKLKTEFPDYLEKNASKLSPADVQRYVSQQKIVQELVAKFEEPGYSDDDSQCREYVWERMQKMQELGSPPEDLLGAQIPGMGGLAGFGAGGGAEDAGCPTQ